MRTAAITALGLILATGSAWAQSSYDSRYNYRDRDQDSAHGYNTSQSYSSDHASRNGWTGDKPVSHDHDKGGRSRGATFHLKSGDKEFKVECGDDDSTRECVDAALMIFRQTQDATHASRPTGAGTSTSASPVTPPTTSGAGGSPAAGSTTR